MIIMLILQSKYIKSKAKNTTFAIIGKTLKNKFSIIISKALIPLFIFFKTLPVFLLEWKRIDNLCKCAKITSENFACILYSNLIITNKEALKIQLSNNFTVK